MTIVARINQYASLNTSNEFNEIETSNVGVDTTGIFNSYEFNENIAAITNDVGFISTLSGASTDLANAVAVDNFGNIYATGFTNNGINADILIVKYDTNGNVKWQRTLASAPSAIDEHGSGIAVDSLGDIYVVSHTITPYDIIIAKYNSSGTLLWQSKFGSADNDISLSIAVDSSNNFYISGYSYVATSYRHLTAKFNTNGNILWQRTLDAASTDTGIGIAVDSSGNAYVSGYTTGSTADILIAKYNTLGTLMWQRTLASPNNDFGQKIAVDSSGFIYTCGYVDPAASAEYNILIAKYDTNGTLLWQRTLFSANADYGLGISVDSSGNFYISGFIWNGSNNDVIIAKYDTNGTLLWQRTLSSPNDDRGNAIAVDPSGTKLYIAGRTNDNFMLVKLPSDGTGIGTYGSFTYASSGLTTAISGLTTAISGLTTATSGLTTSIISFNSTASGLTTSILGISTLPTLPVILNTYPAYDPVQDEFAGTLYGPGKGTYVRQKSDQSVVVYNEINEFDLIPTVVLTQSTSSLNEGGTINFSITATNVEDGVPLYYEIITPSPTATLTQSATSVKSGTSISFDATTVNVGNATTLSYDIVGTVVSSDFADNSLTGITTVTGGIIDTITKTTAGSGDKTFTLNLRSQGNILTTSNIVTITPPELYQFSSFTFTNATAEGTTGPTLANLQLAYSTQSWASNTSYLNLYSSKQGYQYWAVPADATYRIKAAGAQGGAGKWNNYYGGFGAIMQATITLVQGDFLIFVVGQRGGYPDTNSNGSAGGGGGTFVYKNNLFLPILVAGGGGGGGGNGSNQNGKSGETTNAGGTNSSGQSGGTLGAGGITYGGGGGGAGLTGSGGAGVDTAAGGLDITNLAGTGGRGGSCSASQRQILGNRNFNNLGQDQGGFGGGGGGEWCSQGGVGGGGGYSGGAGNNTSNGVGGGGGSYFNPSLATLIGTSNGKYNGAGTYQNLGYNGSFLLNTIFSNSMGYVLVEKIS